MAFPCIQPGCGADAVSPALSPHDATEWFCAPHAADSSINHKAERFAFLFPGRDAASGNPHRTGA